MKKSVRHQADPDLFERAENTPHSTKLLKFSGTDCSLTSTARRAVNVWLRTRYAGGKL